jgi:hypothetical protein
MGYALTSKLEEGARHGVQRSGMMPLATAARS